MKTLPKEIKIHIKTVYGVETYYPACTASVLFSDIANTKTLTKKTLSKIKELGLAITVLPKILEL